MDRGKPEAEELALHDRQELETWTREAARESVNLGSWVTSSRGSDGSKDLDQQAWPTNSGTPKSSEHLENWGRKHPAGSEPGDREGEGGLQATGVAADSSPTAESRECATAGGVENRSAAARARSGLSPEFTARGRSSPGAAAGYGSSMSSSSGAPCGACKFLRRKCVRGCIFAPYFGAEQGAAKFAAVHKVFGASNVAKLLLHIPTPRRCDAVLTISYEAQARLSDPVYGCVATIFALQQQVASLQAELAMVQAQLADRHAHLQQTHHQHQQRMVQQQQQGFAASQAPPEYMLHLPDHSTSGLSMGMPGGAGANNPYTSRVKPEEESSYHLHGLQQHQHQQQQQQQHQHHYDLGMPSSSLQDHSEHSLLESLQKSRSGGMGDQPDGGELQALASLLRRK